MTPSDLLMDLIDLGVRLRAIDDRLVYVAPHGAMTADLVEQLREQKAEVIALMARRMCKTCGSFGRCELRVPMVDGEWACQAALSAGLLSDSRTQKARRRRLQAPSAPPGERLEPAGPTVMDQVQVQVQPRKVSEGCGERVPVRTAEGVVWVRCTGRHTCDGVCSRAEHWTEAVS
jgi:hypothetical protein